MEPPACSSREEPELRVAGVKGEWPWQLQHQVQEEERSDGFV